MSRKAFSLLRKAASGSFAIRSFATAGPAAIPSNSISPHHSPPPHQVSDSDSIPTSSRYTLDHPFWVGRPNPTTSALAFATDDELFQTLLLHKSDTGGIERGPAGVKGKGKEEQEDWTTTLDLSLAFTTLRSRPTYTAFLQCIHPFLHTVYPRLKEHNQHQLLVSDLLLRHPDPRLLRDLLELDAQIARSSPSPSPTPRRKAEHLRPSIVTSIHSIIAWQIRRGSLKPLDYRSHLLVCRSLAAQDDIPATVQSWHTLRLASMNMNSTTGYTLITFVFRVARTDPTAAFGMLHSLVRDEIVPRGILLKRLGNHPNRVQIIVMAAVIRSCLYWNMDQRARIHAGQLLDLILDSPGQVEDAAEAVDLVMDVIRGSKSKGSSSAQNGGLDWCADMFKRMAQDPNGPEIPAPLFNSWLDAVHSNYRPSSERSPSYSSDIWQALPEGRRPVVSAKNILAMAETCSNEDTFRNLLQSLCDLDPSTTLTVSRPLLSLIAKQRIPISTRRNLLDLLLRHWSGRLLNIGGKDLVVLIKSMRADKERCHAILAAYEARLLAEYDRRGKITMEENIAMVNAHLLLKDTEGGNAWLQNLDTDLTAVRGGLWEMGLGNANVRIALKKLLRRDHSISEAKAIMSTPP